MKLIYWFLGIAVVLVLGILFMSGSVLPEALKEDYIKEMTTFEYGESKNPNEYLVYIYHPRCSYCQKLMQGSIYQNFIARPGIKMYKVSTNDDPSIEEYNPNMYKGFLDEIGVTGTPTLFYIREKTNGRYVIKKAIGVPDAETLLKKYTA